MTADHCQQSPNADSHTTYAPARTAKLDVPHTSCIVGLLKSLARNSREGERA